MDPGHHSEEAELASADEMFAKRGCCSIWMPWQNEGSSKAWERIQPIKGDGGAPSATGRSLWRRGMKALVKVREWSEVVAGPQWKTFLRRFGRRSKHSSARPGGKFRYDPLSYARNFDEGQGSDSDSDTVRRGFTARYATPPASTKTSIDFGGREPLPFILDDEEY